MMIKPRKTIHRETFLVEESYILHGWSTNPFLRPSSRICCERNVSAILPLISDGCRDEGMHMAGTVHAAVRWV